MTKWLKGRVFLVGDACGCPTLLSGQGASLAMGGAYMLAKALYETADYQDAFCRYEIQVRPHVEERQKNARDLAKSFVPRSKSGHARDTPPLPCSSAQLQERNHHYEHIDLL